MGFLLDPHVFAPTPPLPPSLGSPVKCQKFPQGIQVCAIPSFVQLSIPTVARVPYGPPSHAHCTCHLVKPVVPAAQRGHSLQNFLSPPNSISPSPDALHVSGHRVLSLVDRKGWCRPPPPASSPSRLPLALATLLTGDPSFGPWLLKGLWAPGFHLHRDAQLSY